MHVQDQRQARQNKEDRQTSGHHSASASHSAARAVSKDSINCDSRMGLAAFKQSLIARPTPRRQEGK